MHLRNTGPTLDYITRTFVHEPEWIAAARAAGEQRCPGMQISPYEGHLLQWLVRISGATHILEIGTFMGVSTLWMAGGLPKGGTLTSLEMSVEHTQQARAHVAASPQADCITIHHADARTWLATLSESPRVDLAFIDAEKRSYAAYLEGVLPRMAPRGWIIGDNTLLFGALSGEHPDAANEASIAAMAQFNTTLADPSRFESVLLPTPEGLTVARLV